MVDSLLTQIGIETEQLNAWGIDRVILGSELWRWIGGALTLLGLWMVLSLVLRFLRSRKEPQESLLRRAVWAIAQSTGYWFVASIAFRVGAAWLKLEGGWDAAVGWSFTGLLWLQLGIWGNRLLTTILEHGFRARLEENAAHRTSLDAIRYIGQLVLWSAILLLALENFQIDVSALVAGFGIGGIAVALAAQSVLADLFASLAIVLDRPFEVGDFIIVGDMLGKVEKIGLKTTRIRSLGGEQIIFTNTDLLSSRVRNYKRMEERRVVFHFGVLYQTKPEQLRKVTELAKKAIEDTDHVRFDRVHFYQFGDSSLDFEAVYYVEGNDYNRYMDVQQAINLGLVESFEEIGVEFAYPTRTLHLEVPDRPLKFERNGHDEGEEVEAAAEEG